MDEALRHYTKARAHMDGGEFAEAAVAFQLSLDMCDHMLCRQLLGICLGMLGRFEECFEQLRDVLKKQPGNPGALIALVQALIADRQFDVAVSEYRSRFATGVHKSFKPYLYWDSQLAQLFDVTEDDLRKWRKKISQQYDLQLYESLAMVYRPKCTPERWNFELDYWDKQQSRYESGDQ